MGGRNFAPDPLGERTGLPITLASGKGDGCPLPNPPHFWPLGPHSVPLRALLNPLHDKILHTSLQLHLNATTVLLQIFVTSADTKIFFELEQTYSSVC